MVPLFYQLYRFDEKAQENKATNNPYLTNSPNGPYYFYPFYISRLNLSCLHELNLSCLHELMNKPSCLIALMAMNLSLFPCGCPQAEIYHNTF